jgi:hypothetical protein
VLTDDSLGLRAEQYMSHEWATGTHVRTPYSITFHDWMDWRTERGQRLAEDSSISTGITRHSDTSLFLFSLKERGTMAS